MHQPIAACAAPTPEEVEAAKSELNDFVAIRFASDDLVATSMTPDELDAVAYFWVAADLQHRPERFDDTPSDWRHPGPESPERERLWQRLGAAEQAHDRVETARWAHAYLETLGFPGRVRGHEEDAYSWHGPRYASVMLSLAVADEALGNDEEAATLYERAPVSGGPCGTGVYETAIAQRQAFIRAAEHSRGCRSTVMSRLMAYRSFSFETDLFKPLEDVGFDRERLLRGVFVSRYRGIGVDAIGGALAKAPRSLREPALLRLKQNGSEEWFSDAGGFRSLTPHSRDAIPMLVDAALAHSRADPGNKGLLDLRVGALRSLSSLFFRDERDPCAPDEITVDGATYRTGAWVGGDALSSCAECLKKPERDALASQLMPLLRDKARVIRSAAVQALSAVGSPTAISSLEELTNDPSSGDEVIKAIERLRYFVTRSSSQTR